MPRIITVSGMIGAGKSTFIKQYASYLDYKYGVSVTTLLEPVESNELLTMMYEDPKRWTYTSQVRFLVDKMNSMKKAMDPANGIVLVERDYREQKIFIDAQLVVGSVTQIEYDSYMELYETCAEFMPSVTNYHLDIPFEVCLYRMQERGRSFESLGTTEYYRVLYDTYKKSYSDHPSEYILKESVDLSMYGDLDKFTFRGVYIT